MIKLLPKISIVTPSLNQGKYLESTILSVLNQDYPCLEYIVIDGGSTDNSIEIIKKYESCLSYWISEPDSGQPEAINKGLHKSNGDILHWLNSDDELLPGTLFLLAYYFRDHPEIGCVMGDLEIIDSGGLTLTLKKAVPFDFHTSLYSACLVPQPSTMFRRSAWQSTGDLNTSLHYQFDFEYFLRMAALGIKFDILGKPLAKFRLHKESKTISRYHDSFFQLQYSIQEPYLCGVIKSIPCKDRLLKFLKVLYKLRMLIVRAVLRGDPSPFRAKRARTAANK